MPCLLHMVVYAFHGFPVKILTWKIHDDNKAAYNVLHFFADSSAGE